MQKSGFATFCNFATGLYLPLPDFFTRTIDIVPAQASFREKGASFPHSIRFLKRGFDVIRVQLAVLRARNRMPSCIKMCDASIFRARSENESKWIEMPLLAIFLISTGSAKGNFHVSCLRQTVLTLHFGGRILVGRQPLHADQVSDAGRNRRNWSVDCNCVIIADID
jgi:hypothetical protein